MAIKKNHTIAYIPGISGVSRKFALRRDTCIDKEYASGVTTDGVSYLGGSVHTKNLLGVGEVKNNFVFMRMAMKKPRATAAQSEVRTFFTLCVGWVNAAMKDISTISENKAKIKEAAATHKNIGNASVYGNTFRGVFWDYCYGVVSSTGNVPQSYLLPYPA